MRRVLIYGAGEAGIMVLNELKRHSEEKREIWGFIDDDKEKIGKSIQGVKVWGGKETLQRVIHELQINEVIIAMPSISKTIIKGIVTICKAEKITLLIVPSTIEIIEGSVRIDQIKKLNLSDLLDRDEVRLFPETIKEYITNNCVMVTGAAGSIGSELVKKLIQFHPSCIIALDIYENGLFYLMQEIERQGTIIPTRVIPCIVDIKNKQILEEILVRYEPEIVFHAAAYKHVPLMEHHIRVAFLNNVIGTLNILELSHTLCVKKYIGISTDKAVYPVSVMGKTKRLSELMVGAYASVGLNACSVRFGNVLGSNGSVLKVFKDQIRRGGPITITSPDMERYFMTVEEAVSLLLQAGSIGEKGNVYVLDMGKPIRIKELAENMIILSGFMPGVDIQIQYTGLREGEKFTERLFYREAEVVKSILQGIYIEKNHVSDLEIIRDVKRIQEEIYIQSEYEIIQSVDDIITLFYKESIPI